MVLLRLIVFKLLLYNVKLTARHVVSEENAFADLLSRLKLKQFWVRARKLNKKFQKTPIQIPADLDMNSLWLH